MYFPLFISFLLLIPTTFTQAPSTRCGNGWSDANTQCHAQCISLEDCTALGYTNCYGSLDTTPCASAPTRTPTAPPTGGPPPTKTPTTKAPTAPPTGGPPPTRTPTAPPSGTTSGTHTLTLTDVQQLMWKNQVPPIDLSQWVTPLNTALARYGMNTPIRIAAFMAQVRHETAGLTVTHQSLDNGGGTLHMTPSNWQFACAAVPEIATAFGQVFPGCGDCSCIPAMAASPLGTDATTASTQVFSRPLVASLSGTWWFAQGAQTPSIFGWKGCGDLRLDSDVGLGSSSGTDCHYTGYYQVTCCIFYTLSESLGSGLTQRISYYNDALGVIAGWTLSGAQADSEAQRSGDSGLSQEGLIGVVVGCVVGVIVIVVVVIVVIVKRRHVHEIV